MATKKVAVSDCTLGGLHCEEVIAENVPLFIGCLAAVYIFHYLVDGMIVRPLSNHLVARRVTKRVKAESLRECLWKLIATTTLFTAGWAINHQEPWFFKHYFSQWPFTMSLPMKIHYFCDMAFWIISTDIHFSLTAKRYDIKRKDYYEICIHHIATLSLMVLAFLVDVTEIGICVILLHDVSDIFLETAKFFRYVNIQILCDSFFAMFVASWIYTRLYLFVTGILQSVFTDGYALQKKLGDLRHYDITSQQYWWIWAVITGFLCLLLVLHTFWSFMIGKMLYNILRAGHDGLSKDIRSDSEVDEDTSAPQKPIQANGVNGTRKRASQRTRKASE